MSEVENIRRILKAWKNDHDNGRMGISEYLRLKNSYELRMEQLQREADGK